MRISTALLILAVAANSGTLASHEAATTTTLLSYTSHDRHQVDGSGRHHHHYGVAAIPKMPYLGHDMMKPSDQVNSSPPPPVVAEAPLPKPQEQPQEQPKQVVWQPEEQKPKPQPNVSRPAPAPVVVPANKKKNIVAYWTDWTSGSMPPEAIPFDKVTHINYAFAIVRPDFTPSFDTDYLLTRVVRSAHAKNVKVLMSIGGWTGSQYFSPLSASADGRRRFIDGAVKFVKDYDLDGIDIDWEYPGRLGSACNIFDQANDAKNFLTLLTELRQELSALPKGDQMEISLATRIVPFDGPNGQLQDVSAFAKLVNHINVMAYDINGSWGKVTGANAPFGGMAGDYSYSGGAMAWINAGFPANQINMGVPFYGRSLTVQQDMIHSDSMSVAFNPLVPHGDNNDGLWTDPCEKTAAFSGVWKFKNLREQGVIDANGDAVAPWIRKFDKDSQTPWLFNTQTKQFISYDDPESLKIKVDFAKDRGLGGVMLWALNQDVSTDDNSLLDVLQEIY